jgi:hypothetical protein
MAHRIPVEVDARILITELELIESEKSHMSTLDCTSGVMQFF